MFFNKINQFLFLGTFTLFISSNILGMQKVTADQFILALLASSNAFGIQNTSAKQIIPYVAKPSEQAQYFDISLFLQQLLPAKDTSDLRRDLLTHLQNLKAKNDNGKVITDTEVNNIKQLWDEFKSLHSHNWLDILANPFRKIINPSAPIHKKASLWYHPDHYSKQNISQIESLFISLNDVSRPAKATDPIICATSDIIIGQSVPLIISLANQVCPRLFKNRSFEKVLLKENTQLNRCNQNIITCKNAIKIKEQRINYKKLNLKNLIDSYGTKNRTSRN